MEAAADLRNLGRQSGYSRSTVFSAAHIFGIKSNGTTRVPKELRTKNMTIAQMRTAVDGATEAGREAARKLARANNIQAFAESIHAPLNEQGDCVSFQTDGSHVIEIGLKTAAAASTDDATYEWFVMSDNTETASVEKSGQMVVSGELVGHLKITVETATDTFTRYNFYLGSVTSGGSEDVSTAGGDPFISTIF